MINKLRKIKKLIFDAKDVFRGNKIAIVKKEKKIDFKNNFFTKAEQDYIDSLEINFYFSEFGKIRVNSGGENFEDENCRLDPSLTSIKKYFPNANIFLYTDLDIEIDRVNIIRVNTNIFPDSSHNFNGYHLADFYKFHALANASGDFNCVMDSDMDIVSSNIIALIYMTQKFGFCVPHNNRQSMIKDMRISQNTINVKDESKGLGYAYNQSPMTIWKDDSKGKAYFKKCCEELVRQPAKASYAMWSASWETGIYPYILPKEWCVSTGDEGLGDEVILHLGHTSINKYYNL